MTRSRWLVGTLGLALLLSAAVACGKYGPPLRSKPATAEASPDATTEEPEPDAAMAEESP